MPSKIITRILRIAFRITCPNETNITINIASVRSLLGLGTFADPLTAHTGYSKRRANSFIEGARTVTESVSTTPDPSIG